MYIEKISATLKLFDLLERNTAFVLLFLLIYQLLLSCYCK